MSTLNYADEKLRKRLPTQWAWALLVAAVVLVLLVPAGGTFLRKFYFPDPPFLSETAILYVIWIAPSAALLAWMYVLIRVMRVRDDGRATRLKKCLWPMAIAIALLPICWLTYQYRNIVVEHLAARHSAAMAKGQRLANGLREYLQDNAKFKWRYVEDFGQYPPHLAALVTSKTVNASDLVFDGAGAAVPETTVKADWPRFALQIEANCDWVYVGADVVNDRALDGTRMEGNEIIIAYSRESFFPVGHLVIDAERRVQFVRSRDLAARFAKHNERRAEFFLPAQAMWTNYPAPPGWSGPPRVALREESRRETYAPQYMSGRLAFPTALQSAVLNYAIDHDGYFPPHPAALIAGQYLRGQDLIDTSGMTTPYTGSTHGMREGDWQRIAREVDEHSDFIFSAADLRLPAGAPYTVGRRFGVVTYYSKLLHPDEMRLAYSAIGLDATCSSYLWRERWIVSNRNRAAIKLPALTPDTPHPNPYGAAIMGEPQGKDSAMEISRRNASVIATQLRILWEPPFTPVGITVFKMAQRGWISPRHLKDPATKTALLSIEKIASTTGSTSEQKSGSEDFAKSVDYQIVAGIINRNKRDTDPVVYSLHTFGGTGRMVGYWDGSAQFVEKDKLPAGVEIVD